MGLSSNGLLELKSSIVERKLSDGTLLRNDSTNIQPLGLDILGTLYLIEDYVSRRGWLATRSSKGAKGGGAYTKPLELISNEILSDSTVYCGGRTAASANRRFVGPQGGVWGGNAGPLGIREVRNRVN